MKQLFQSNNGTNFDNAIDAITDDIAHAECMFFNIEGKPTVYPEDIQYVYFPTQQALVDYTDICDTLLEYMGCVLPRFTEPQLIGEIYANNNEGEWVYMTHAKILKMMMSFIDKD